MKILTKSDMKKNLLFLFFAVIPLFSFLAVSSAQEKKSGKIHIQITEDDKIVTDTILDLKKGQDPEQIKKMISSIVGDDFFIHAADGKGFKIMRISSDDEGQVWHIEDLDSIKEAHGEGKLLVFKGEGGDVEVKVLSGKHKSIIISGDQCEDEEEYKIIMEELDDEKGKHIIKMDGGEIIIISYGNGEESEEIEKEVIKKKMDDDTVKLKSHKTIWISETGEDEKKEKKVVIKTYEGKDLKEVYEDSVKVIVTTDEDIEWIRSEESDEDVKVYIIKKEGKEKKKQIKIKVETIDEEEEEGNKDKK